MPLSEHEQNILREIERQFYEDDPKFARGVATGTLQTNAKRNLRRGIALSVLGFLVLITFFLKTVVIVGVIAFLLMLAGFILSYQSLRRLAADRPEEGSGGSTRPNAPVSRLLSGVEERLRDLRRRRDQ